MMLTINRQPMTFINGSIWNDYLEGTSSSDSIFAHEGDDILNGGGYSYDSFEYDTLTGGAGADTFVLGDYFGAQYEGFGYATITDFDWEEGDKIQVFGGLNDYYVSTNGSGGVDILYQGYLLAQVTNTRDVIAVYDFIFI